MKLHCAIVCFLSVMLASPLAKADVRITGFSEFNFGSWGGSGNFSDETNLCVYNSDGDEYNITATAGGTFQLTAGANNVAYVPAFQGSSGGFQTLSHGVARTFSDAHRTSETCDGGTNAKLRITVNEAALEAAKPGNYEATITVLLEPAP